MHPLGYFASAPDGTKDAAILFELLSRYGSYLEKLNSEQKLALRAYLSYYLFYKLKYVSDYSVSDAITDAMPECTEASIRLVIATLEGIKSDNASGVVLNSNGKVIKEKITWCFHELFQVPVGSNHQIRTHALR